MSDTPDYTSRIKLHGNRPGPNDGPYQRRVIGDASVSADFGDSRLVGVAINDHDAAALVPDARLHGVLMVLDAREAYALGAELQLAAMVADASINPDQERAW